MRIKIHTEWPSWLWVAKEITGHYTEIGFTFFGLTIFRLYINYAGFTGITLFGVGIEIRHPSK